MGISFSQQRVLGIPSNQFVRLLICGHAFICIRVGFKKWNKILILCSIVLGTRYVMLGGYWQDTGKDYNVEELKLELQASNSFIQSVIQELNVQKQAVAIKQQSINKLSSSLRQGIKRSYFLY